MLRHGATITMLILCCVIIPADEDIPHHHSVINYYEENPQSDIENAVISLSLATCFTTGLFYYSVTHIPQGERAGTLEISHVLGTFGSTLMIYPCMLYTCYVFLCNATKRHTHVARLERIPQAPTTPHATTVNVDNYIISSTNANNLPTFVNNDINNLPSTVQYNQNGAFREIRDYYHVTHQPPSQWLFHMSQR